MAAAVRLASKDHEDKVAAFEAACATLEASAATLNAGGEAPDLDGSCSGMLPSLPCLRAHRRRAMQSQVSTSAVAGRGAVRVFHATRAALRCSPEGDQVCSREWDQRVVANSGRGSVPGIGSHDRSPTQRTRRCLHRPGPLGVGGARTDTAPCPVFEPRYAVGARCRGGSAVGSSPTGVRREGPSMRTVVQRWRNLSSRAATIAFWPRNAYHSS